MNNLTKYEFISLELTKAIYAKQPPIKSDNPAFDIFVLFRDVLKIIKNDPELHN